MQLEKQIKDDVREWSRLQLEVPNQHLNGMPACPFAKKSWKEKKVLIKIKRKFKQYKAELNTHVNNLDLEKYDLLIFCDPYFNYSTPVFQEYIDSYNQWYNKKDIYFMGFHPGALPTEEEHAFLIDPGTEDLYDEQIQYSMMLAQKFSLLQEASDRLHKAGYYRGWPKEYYNEVVKTRYKAYNKVRRSL